MTRQFARRRNLPLLGFFIGSSLSLFSASAYGLPNLVIHAASANPYIDYITFAADSCEVNEGCALPGVRRLLHFECESRNRGTSDLVFGDPANNPLFVYDPCHGHYHFGEFARYRLLTQSGAVALEGHKMGFCLEDTIRWSSAAGTTRKYNCGYQGIQVGWADVYTYDVPCQWLDITDVPPGSYILEMTVDPNNIIRETDETDNTVQVPVDIPADCSSMRPANDNIANAISLTAPAAVSGSTSCATKEAGEPNHAGDTGGHSVWYRWTAPTTKPVIINTIGSGFDTLLAVYRYSGSTLTLVAENDDIVYQVVRVSQLTLQAQAGVTYWIAIDGWQGENGGYKLNLDAPPNDPFANCFSIAGMSGTLSGYNIGATREDGEPTHAATFGDHSVWYCWTAPRNGIAEVDTFGSSFDTSLAIYTGSSVSALTTIASDNDTGPNGTSITRFNAVSGTTYHIAVDGRQDAAGNILLHWRYPAAKLVAARAPSTQVQITLSGENGQYRLESSADLKTWSSVTTITVANGTGSYTQTRSGASRFYRAGLIQ